MPDESQDARIAVAVNDIDWIKESQRTTNRGLEQLQQTLSQHIKEQNERSEKFATKDELNVVKNDVDKLKMKVYVFSGVVTTIIFIVQYGHKLF
ncbi:hypothetical protein NZD89_09390 [Alicyclobacillus fastidiosus]|uniref:Uncharacterized protein n=1 Tax=Alicyclobacillus fastidiosus TaxID=392011 RepID=A0ABY6ZL88_9BACL|nr:hypothetical protein [Alicyclobacillus fastidiosus]WAH43570.1 hypothetical protein NZD89_09390 [Alicyclobacillus fastidiosus]GMA59748.1 hypothetical protein GCM10025859_01880 [Alicyclobacillus fastidiosus]